MRDSLKLRQVRCFIAVAEELSFRRAAERLFMTQPPLSRQIKRLEETLDVRLFDRNHQGVSLTEAGRHFLVEARTLALKSEQILARFRPTETKVGATITLGITTMIDASLFGSVEAAFEKRFPGNHVNVRRQISAQSIRDLHAGAIDVAVIGLPSRSEGLKVKHLFDDPMVAVVASTHPMAKKRRVSILDFREDKLFWFNRNLNPAYHDHCQRFFEHIGFYPQRVPEPDDHHVLLGLIAVGHGIALIPKSLSSTTRKGVVFKRIIEGGHLGVHIGAAYKMSETSEVVLALVEMLKGVVLTTM